MIAVHDRLEKVNCSLSLRRFKSDQIYVYSYTLNLNESDVINNKLFLKTYVQNDRESTQLIGIP